MKRTVVAVECSPKRGRARAWIGAGGTFALLFFIYMWTLAPALTWSHYGADGGDLVTAVVRGSIPHPPGFPTYLLFGELFIRLPWGEPAWRLNVMSAMLAAGAAALTASWVEYLSCPDSGSSTSDLPSVIFVGLSLGLSPLFWSQALIAEVYAPAALCAALVILLASRADRSWALGLAWGVGVGSHPILVFLAPVVVWGTWGTEQGRLGRLLRLGLLALLGWGVMAGPVLISRRGAPSPWGSLDTFSGWWALVSGQLYRRYIFGLPLTAWPKRILAWAGVLVRQFTPLGAVLAGLGWLRLWRERRPLAGASAIAFGVFSLYAIGYNTADSLVYLVPALPLAALWLGRGVAQASAWLRKRWRVGGWVILFLPLLQALLFWGRVDLRGERTAMEWAERALGEAPQRAILVTAQDAHTFTLWYTQEVLGQRPDVVVVDRDLWAQDAYRRIVGEALDLEIVEDGLSPEQAMRRSGRPVIAVTALE